MKFWVSTMILATALAAVLAFHGSVPAPQPPRPALAGGWSELMPAGVEGRLVSSGEAWAHRVEVRRGRTRSARAARTWLLSRTAGAAGTARAAAAASGGAARRIDEFSAWARHLDRSVVQVQVDAVRWQGVEGSSTTIVPATFTVQVRQSLERTRRHDVAVTLTVRRQADGSWAVADVRSPRRGLRSMRAPLVVAAGEMHVVADASLASFAGLAAAEAERTRQLLVRRYGALGGPRHGTLYVLENNTQVREVLDRPAMPARSHSSAWTYETGDVVLWWPQMGRMGQLEQRGTVRHEMTHMITLPIISVAPVAVLEGLAMREEARLVYAESGRLLELDGLRSAFRDGSLGYQQLLRTKSANFGQSGVEGLTRGYLVGYSTIGYIERHWSHDRLVQLLSALRTGHSLDTALKQVLGIDARELERGVRVWVADGVRVREQQMVQRRQVQRRSGGE